MAPPAINNAGTVAFTADLDAGGRVLLTGSGGPTTTIADTSGPFNFFDFLSINDAGTVAFRAFLDAGGSGIFTGPDPVADQVIGSGDPLAGSTVVGLGVAFAFVGDGLNDSGQIAFLAFLADGRQVIVRADPVSGVIPEPSSLALLGVGLLTHIPHLRLKVRRGSGGMPSKRSNFCWMSVGWANRRCVLP